MKRHFAHLLCLAGLGLLLVLPAQAQPGFPGFGGPGGGDRHLRILAEFLDLSAEQEEAWKSAHEGHREDVRGILEEQRELAQQLNELLGSDSPDPSEVGDLVLAQRAAHDRVRAAQEALRTELTAVLTADQMVRYEAFLAAQQLLRGGPGSHRPRRGGGRR